MQSKSQQIGLISNLLDQVSGLDTETKDRIDLEAEIDSELSVSENWEELKDKYGIKPESELMEELNDHSEMTDEEYYRDQAEPWRQSTESTPKPGGFRDLTSGEDYRALDYWSKRLNPFIKEWTEPEKRAC